MDGKKIAAAGVLAYLYWRYRGSAVPSTPIVPGSQASSGSLDDSKIHLDYCVGGSDVVYGDGGFILDDHMPDAIDVAAEKAQLGNGQSMVGRTLGTAMWGIHHQLVEPASRVKDRDLQPYHFQLANAMLSGILSRDDKRGRLYTKLMDDVAQNKKDAEDLAKANTAISAVASIIPVVGGVIALATSTGLKAGIQGATQNIQHDLEAAQTIDHVKAGLGIGSPEGRAWLANGKYGSTEAPIDQQYVHADNGVVVNICSIGLTEIGWYYYTDHDMNPTSIGGVPTGQFYVRAGDSVSGAVATYSESVTTNGYTRSVTRIRPGFGFRKVQARMRLFSMHPYGWILPWNSEQLSSRESTRRKIAICAPTLRAFDRMCCSEDPRVPPGDAVGVPGFYWYNSPVFGPVWGSIFPPNVAEGDTRLQDGLHYWGWNGQNETKGVIGSESTRVNGLDQSTLVAKQAATQSIVDAGSTGQPAPQPVGEDYGQAASVAAATTAAQSSLTTTSKAAITGRSYR